MIVCLDFNHKKQDEENQKEQISVVAINYQEKKKQHINIRFDFSSSFENNSFNYVDQLFDIEDLDRKTYEAIAM